MADMQEVLHKLVDRTIQNRVPWRKSTFSGAFQASFGNLIVLIVGNRNGQERDVHLSVKDKRGDTVGSIFYNANRPNENQKLASLYGLAERTASDDPRLDELLEALDVDPPVS